MGNNQIIFLVYWLLLISTAVVISQESYSEHELIVSEGSRNNFTFSNHTFVVFDPSVSALDISNLNRYNSTQQIPLVAKVATQFRHVFIKLSEIDFDNNLQTSLCQSAFAVAEYNKLNTSERKLQVYLSYSSDRIDYPYKQDNIPYHQDPRRVIDKLHSIAQESNAIFNGTVTSILIPYKMLVNNNNHHIISNNGRLNYTFSVDLTWGLLFETEVFFRYESVTSQVSTLQPNVIILIFAPRSYAYKLKEHVDFHLNEVRSIIDIQNLTFGYMATISDTDFTGKVNMSNLVSLWRQADNWSCETGYTVVLSKAFDTPVGDSVERKTSGWWRLVENPRYNSTADYMFEEKAVLAEKENGLQTETSLTWLKNNMKFSKDHTEIIFSLFDRTREKTLQRLSDVELNSLLKNMLADFHSLVLVLHEESERGTRVILYELQCLNKIFEKENFSITVILLPHVDLNRMFERDISLGQIKKEYSAFFPLLNAIKNYVVPYDGNRTGVGIKEKYLKGVDPSEYILGIAFNISSCTAMSQQEWDVAVGHALLHTNASEMVFYFEEGEFSVKLGAERMFQQRLVTMEMCKKLVLTHHQPAITKLSFMLLHYSTSTEFYTSKWELVNFITYWKMLNDWANETGSHVILNNIMDAHRHFKIKNQDATELGWWRLLTYREIKDSNEENVVWINKIDDALLRFPEGDKTTSALTVVELTLIVMCSLALVVLVGVSVAYYVIRARKREQIFSKEEESEFIKGKEISLVADERNRDSMYTNMPYDQKRFEVDRDAFSIDQDGALGAGEFGMVCRGKLHIRGEEELSVAIKMVNSQNIHKTTISGFLSEIKVLSHLGKHNHVTELLGANTKNLRIGKVFILLELCELGSLEKYLQKMRPRALPGGDVGNNGNGSEQEENVYENLERYTNMVPLKKRHLDSLQSQHLIRWSKEICKGMAYLASKHVVHADLATRNVLLDSNKVAKICDFGLSRRMYNYTNYVKQKQEPLPWKWMSPESLRLLEFNEKSDVWAYGITLWEIFSLGDKPYPGLSWNLDFVDLLEGGLRLGRPKFDDKNTYLIMEECWNIEPEMRPSFADLLLMFNKKVVAK